MFYVGKAMGRTFSSASMANDPDPEIVKLNADVVVFDEVLGTHLPEPQQRYASRFVYNLNSARGTNQRP